MAEFQTALKPDNIFLLDKDKPFADTSMETWIAIMSMFRDLDNELFHLDPPVDRRQHVVVDELCRKHPFLEFIKGKPRPGNPYWEFGARLYVWSAAFDALGYSQFKHEHDNLPWDGDILYWDGNNHSLDGRGFQKNINKLSQGDYELLWNPRWFWLMDREYLGGDDFLSIRPQISNQKTLLLRRYAYGELWAFTQRLKLQDLTSAQEQDRQKLELWTISQIKETLIAHELEPTCPSRLDESDVEPEKIYDYYDENETSKEFFLKAKAVATRIVEKRIAKGNWQVRGPHKYNFKFNGIETDTSCSEQK